MAKPTIKSLTADKEALEADLAKERKVSKSRQTQLKKLKASAVSSERLAEVCHEMEAMAPNKANYRIALKMVQGLVA